MLSHCRQYQPCPVLIVLAVGSAAEGGLANIFSNIQHATDTPDRGDQQCNAPWYLDNEHILFCKADITANKFALLWGEAQLCLPYVCLQKKSNDL